MTDPNELWLVRHGATDWNTAGRLTGWTDIPLNPEGRNQAASLRGLLTRRSYTQVWSSDLTRALETARLAWGEPHIDDRLREINFGSLEGTRWNQLKPSTQEALVAFDGFAAPDGESVTDLRQRVAAFLTSLASGHHVVFTHGGVIQLLLRARGQHRHIQPGQLIRIPTPHLGR